MPQRFLRPGITTSKRWNRCGWLSQAFYVRLLTLVDDFGRYDADFQLLRSHAFPFGDAKGKDVAPKVVELACRELSANHLVTFYTDGDGKETLQIQRWQERPRAIKSKYEPFDNKCLQMFTDDNKCSPPSSSSSPSPLHPRHSSNGSQANTSEPSDEEWLLELSKSKAYQGIDVPREFSKMEQWCKTTKKNPSRRRFINWLNKCERPLNVASHKRNVSHPKPQPEGWEAWRQKHYPTARETDFWRVSGDVQAEFRKG